MKDPATIEDCEKIHDRLLVSHEIIADVYGITHQHSMDFETIENMSFDECLESMENITHLQSKAQSDLFKQLRKLAEYDQQHKRKLTASKALNTIQREYILEDILRDPQLVTIDDCYFSYKFSLN